MDYRITRALDHFAARHDGFEDPLRAYVAASEYLFFALVAALVVLAVARREDLVRAAGIRAGAGAALGLAVAAVLGRVIDRPRPFAAHHDIVLLVPHAADAGMPSDHATAAFAIAVAVLTVHRRAGLIVLAGAVVLAVGRVFLGVHYLGDVVAGAALGVLAALVVAALARRLPAVSLGRRAGAAAG
jgi:undecaprenyl-diphosphatase